MNLAPIALFVYSRPWHTEQTLNALMQNELADQSTLYICADGPKENATPEDLQKINDTRKLIKSNAWCKEVIIVERERNFGLADSIVDGVTEVVNKHGKIIVLEDDIVTSPGFLKYMNDALNLYENEEKAMHISGFMFPVSSKLPSTFFYNPTSCWGWGTWQRSWKYFRSDAQYLVSCIDNNGLKNKFNVENSCDFYDQLTANIEGTVKTWAAKWYASCFIVGGLSLHPFPSLVNNVGIDGTGENCAASNDFHWKELASTISVRKIKLAESLAAIKAMIKFNRKLNRLSPSGNPFRLRTIVKRLLFYNQIRK